MFSASSTELATMFFVLIVSGIPQATYRSRAAASKWNNRLYAGQAEIRQVETEAELDALFAQEA